MVLEDLKITSQSGGTHDEFACSMVPIEGDCDLLLAMWDAMIRQSKNFNLGLSGSRLAPWRKGGPVVFLSIFPIAPLIRVCTNEVGHLFANLHCAWLEQGLLIQFWVR